MPTLLAELSSATALVAQAMLGWLGTPMSRQSDLLAHAGGFVAQVHLDCTAWWPSLWLLTALGSLGALARVPRRRLLWGAVAGVALMVLLNQVRLVAVLWCGVHLPGHFGWVHEVFGPLALVAAGAAVVVQVVWRAGGRAPLDALAARPTVALRSACVQRAAFGPRSAIHLCSAIAPRSGIDPSAAIDQRSASARPSAVALRGALAVWALVPTATWSAVPAPDAGPSAPTPPARATSPAAPIVSGDVIVKFRDGSEPGAQLAAVLAGQRTVASMAPLAARLSEQTGVPLALVQVTSGREALLGLDREALARTLLSRAGREGAVRRAAMTVPPPAARLPGAELVLRIDVHGNSSAATREALPGRLALGTLLRPSVLVRDAASSSLELRYDIDALTLALIGRLQQRPEVEYAQANRLLRPMPSAAAAGPAVGGAVVPPAAASTAPPPAPTSAPPSAPRR